MKKIICLMCATALLSSCHIYKSYDRPEDITTAGLYRDTASVNNTLAHKDRLHTKRGCFIHPLFIDYPLQNNIRRYLL